MMKLWKGCTSDLVTKFEMEMDSIIHFGSTFLHNISDNEITKRK
jgi:hypothetical protein